MPCIEDEQKSGVIWTGAIPFSGSKFNLEKTMGSLSESKNMFGHEKLDVYQLSIDYVAWVFAEAKKLSGIHRQAWDQWLRASQSIPLDRIAAMLSKLGGRGYRVKEEAVTYGAFDSDTDTDSEAGKS